MWTALAAHPLNAGLDEPTEAYEPQSGECWQYMDTTADGLHEFRHRRHPRTLEREYVRIPELAIGALVEIMPAFSCDTHRCDRRDEWTGLRGRVEAIQGADVLVETHGQEVWMNVERLHIL
jgi:hypothetical protein